MNIANQNFFSTVELLETLMLDGKSSLEPSSSGILISNNLLLTAAHCVGYFSHAKFPHTSFEEIIEIEEVLTFCKEEDEHFDIAIVKLSKKVPDTIKPVCILDEGYKIESKTELVVAGFGVSGDIDGKSTLRLINLPFEKYDKNWLIADQRNDQKTSIGDSGGPAYLKIKNKIFLAGVTTGTDQKFEFAAFMNLSLFKEWIIKSAIELNATLPTFENPN
ncbi:MAG: trypsin-like serine protease [Bacteriovorax sp.]|nr:trypsin-like serine protease [Bacteriovorax sp.]